MGAPQLRDIFAGLSQKSLKVDSYFPVYQVLFERFREKQDLIFVEIGVLNGGSLLMWREFFGPAARIIGVDYSPTAERMRDKGFEIYIGDQASSEFWDRFFNDIGPIDILLDDGGHTNKHQIVTVECALSHIKDGGLIVTEDTHTSYLRDWGNPHKFSFMNYVKSIADHIQLRSHALQGGVNRFSEAVYSICVFESVVAFHVDRRLCRKAELISVGTEEIGAINYWDIEKKLVSHDRIQVLRLRLRHWGIEQIAARAYRSINNFVKRWRFAGENRSLRRYFR